jgi:uncharacterized membrane protein
MRIIKAYLREVLRALNPVVCLFFWFVFIALSLANSVDGNTLKAIVSAVLALGFGLTVIYGSWASTPNITPEKEKSKDE